MHLVRERSTAIIVTCFWLASASASPYPHPHPDPVPSSPHPILVRPSSSSIPLRGPASARREVLRPPVARSQPFDSGVTSSPLHQHPGQAREMQRPRQVRLL